MTRRVRLFGSDHTSLGGIATATLDPGIAIGLSRGLYPKGYSHLDDNEDAVLAATNGSVSVLVVADGHSGFDAAHAAVQSLDDAADAILEMGAHDLEGAVRLGFVQAQDRMARSLAGLGEPRDRSRTALTICVVADGVAAAGTLGDTRAIVRSGRRVRILDGGVGPFLDPESRLDTVPTRSVSVAPGDTVVLISDGVSTFLGGGWMRSLGNLVSKANSQEDFANRVIEASFLGGAGDNIAVASASIGSAAAE